MSTMKILNKQSNIWSNDIFYVNKTDQNNNINIKLDEKHIGMTMAEYVLQDNFDDVFEYINEELDEHVIRDGESDILDEPTNKNWCVIM